jgi:hypothetical protein
MAVISPDIFQVRSICGWCKLNNAPSGLPLNWGTWMARWRAVWGTVSPQNFHPVKYTTHSHLLSTVEYDVGLEVMARYYVPTRISGQVIVMVSVHSVCVRIPYLTNTISPIQSTKVFKENDILLILILCVRLKKHSTVSARNFIQALKHSQMLT